MYEHTLFIGMNDKDTLKQELTLDQYKQTIRKHLGDCTIKEGATGYYTMNNGVQVEEKSLEVKKFGGNKRSITNIAKILKKELNQESIILQTTISKADFI